MCLTTQRNNNVKPVLKSHLSYRLPSGQRQTLQQIWLPWNINEGVMYSTPVALLKDSGIQRSNN